MPPQALLVKYILDQSVLDKCLEENETFPLCLVHVSLRHINKIMPHVHFWISVEKSPNGNMLRLHLLHCVSGSMYEGQMKKCKYEDISLPGTWHYVSEAVVLSVLKGHVPSKWWEMHTQWLCITCQRIRVLNYFTLKASKRTNKSTLLHIIYFLEAPGFWIL
jgi:hypothetical protein